MSVEVLSGVVALTYYATTGTLLALIFIGCTHKKPRRSHLYKSRDPTCESVSFMRQQARSSATQESSNIDEPSKAGMTSRSRYFFTSSKENPKIQESSRIAAESSHPAASSTENPKQPKVQKTSKKKRRFGGQKTTTNASVVSVVGINTLTKQSASAELTKNSAEKTRTSAEKTRTSAEKTRTSAEKTSAENANQVKVPDVTPSMKAIVDWQDKMRQEFPEVTEPTQRGSTASVKQNTLPVSSEAVDVWTPPLNLHEDENGNKYLSSHSSNGSSDQPATAVKKSTKDSVYVLTAQPSVEKKSQYSSKRRDG